MSDAVGKVEHCLCGRRGRNSAKNDGFDGTTPSVSFYAGPSHVKNYNPMASQGFKRSRGRSRSWDICGIERPQNASHERDDASCESRRPDNLRIQTTLGTKAGILSISERFCQHICRLSPRRFCRALVRKLR